MLSDGGVGRPPIAQHLKRAQHAELKGTAVHSALLPCDTPEAIPAPGVPARYSRGEAAFKPPPPAWDSTTTPPAASEPAAPNPKG